MKIITTIISLISILSISAFAAGDVYPTGKYTHCIDNSRFEKNDLRFTATNIVKISSGLQHVATLSSLGVVRVYGEYSWGITNVPIMATNVISISAGDFHTLALTISGKVYAWGAGFNWQCSVPKEATDIIAIAAGGYHSSAIRRDGKIISWGDNRYGQITPPKTLTNAIKISSGTYHNIALTDDGRVVGWGLNNYKQCNIPNGISNVVSIAAKDDVSSALLSDGRIISWGKLTPNQSMPNIFPTNSSGKLHSVYISGGVTPISFQQPESILTVGTRHVIDSGIIGSYPMNFRWFKNGYIINNSSNSFLAITSAGIYECRTVIGTNLSRGNPIYVSENKTFSTNISFIDRDDYTKGNCKSKYGNGYYLLSNLNTNSSYISISSGLPFEYYKPADSDIRAVERVSGGGRFSGCIYDNTTINFTVSKIGKLSIYFMEPAGGRSVAVEIYDYLGNLLDKRNVYNLNIGQYLTWDIKVPVIVKVKKISGSNAVVSGIFISS